MKYYKIIDGETVFFKGSVLRIGTKTIINPTQEHMLAAGWLVYEEPEPTNAEKLAAAKAEKIAQIEAYDSSEYVEQFTINDTPMWLGHELRQQIRTSADAYEANGFETMTKVFDGIEYTFPINTWRQMLNALEIYASEALNTTERHKSTVMAMTRRKDVEDYDYTTDYPEKLVFGNGEE